MDVLPDDGGDAGDDAIDGGDDVVRVNLIYCGRYDRLHCRLHLKLKRKFFFYKFGKH